MVKIFLIAKWSVIRMPFEYRTKLSLVLRPPFEYRTSIQMVVWIPNNHLNTYWTSEYQTSESLLFRCFHYSDVCYSDPHCIQMVVWIPEWKSLLMVQNVRVWMVRQVTWLPFEFLTPMLSGFQKNPVFTCSVFRWLLYNIVTNNPRGLNYESLKNVYFTDNHGRIFKGPRAVPWPNWT